MSGREREICLSSSRLRRISIDREWKVEEGDRAPVCLPRGLQAGHAKKVAIKLPRTGEKKE